MSKIFRLVLVMLVIFAVSILLTPVLSKLLPMFKFEQIFNRLIMIFTVAAAALYVYRKNKRGIRQNFWKVNGFDFETPWKKLFVYGFLSGAIAVAVIIAVEVVSGPGYLRQPLLFQDVVERFFKGMSSGIVIGIVEEFFFRGFIFGRLKEKTHLFIAILLSSAFYSMTHFFDNGQIFIPDHPTTRDSLRLLFGYLEPFVNQWGQIFPEFMGLFLFGIILCLAYLGTDSLFLAIGIHAGAVFAIKFQHSFVRKGPETMVHLFYGRLSDYDGLFEWLMLILLGSVVWFILVPHLKRSISSYKTSH